jgi:hypothetical protein
VWNAADGDGWPFGPLIKLLMLTGQRLAEVGGMRWEELDLEQKLWTLPAERVKNGQRHEVPLSDAAIAVLRAAPRIKTTRGYVFATRRDAAVSGFSRAKDRLDAAIAIAGDEVAAALRAGPDQTSREGQTAAKAAAFRDANSCTPAAKEAGAADGGVEHTTEGPAASSMFAVWQDRGQTALCLLV